MAMTEEELVALLSAEEPDFTELAKLGPEIAPLLQALVQTGDPEIATKAAALAGKIEAPEQEETLRVALAHQLDTVRMAAARGVASLPPELAAPLFAKALADDEAGVRVVAARALPDQVPPQLVAALETAAQSEPDPVVREVFQQAIG